MTSVVPVTDAANAAGHEPDAVREAPRATGPTTEFVQQFTRSQRQLYLFILSLVPSPVDAEEILQETNLIIWRKLDRYTDGTNFLAWAHQIANLEVLKYRERRHRDRLRFSDEFIEHVAAEAEAAIEQSDVRRKILDDCMKKLRAPDRELIQERYSEGENGLSVAKKLGRPANSVYQSLGRIRRALLDCVSKRLTAEAIP